MTQIVFFIPDDLASKKCRPMEIIVKLCEEDKLRLTIEAMEVPLKTGEPTGNCHDISISLMMELIEAGLSSNWRLVKGKVHADRDFDHSWLEYREWVIDASGMDEQGTPVILITDREDLLENRKKRGIIFDEYVSMNDKEVREEFRHTPKKE